LGRRSNAAVDLTFAWRDGTPILDEVDDSDDDNDSDYAPSESTKDPNEDVSVAGVNHDNNNDGHVENPDNDPVDTDNETELVGQGADDDSYNDENEPTDVAAGGENEPTDDVAGGNTNEDAFVEPDADNENENEALGIMGVDETNENDAETPGVRGEANEDNVETPGVHGNLAGVGDDVIDDDEDDNPDVDMDAKYGTRNHSHDLRARKPRDYSHLYSDFEHTI
jgi:hypothetical protein